MTYHTIDITKANQTIKLSSGNYYRSSNFLSNIQKCYEVHIVQILQNYIEVGFTNEPVKREFCIYYGHGGGNGGENDIPWYDQYFNEKDYYETLNFTAQEGDDLMVCIDSNNLKFYMVFKGTQQEFDINKLSNSTNWYVYLDEYMDDPEIILLNLGHTPFKNKMPDGFSPWFEPIKVMTYQQKSRLNPLVYCVLLIIHHNKH